jgi:hypothetical protein
MDNSNTHYLCTTSHMPGIYQKYFLRLANIAVAVLLTATAMPSFADGFTFAAIGDMPYGNDMQFIGLINHLNDEPLAFTLHVGDIKSGSTPCSNETFIKVRSMFDRFDRPLIYTPGDNEWTDCHRKSNGGMDPIERLAKIRSLFFSSPMSFGRQPARMEVQSDQEGYRLYVENRRWVHDRITFATLHLVGSNNNLQRDLKSATEFFARDAANRQWMAETFSAAKARNDIAVVLAMQADTMFEKNPDERTGFNLWLEALEKEAKSWGKPVLLIQGDTHEFKLDQPLVGADMKRVSNVTRLVVHGAQNVHATLIDVQPARPQQPFSFRFLMQGDMAQH